MISRCYFALVLVFSSVGCVTFQDCEYQFAQKCRAHRAWCFGCDERCTYNPFSHYACGWRKGYQDVLMGGNGECPAVPPQCYWSHKFQSEAGECAIENWFLGYSHGAAEAIASCRTQYHHVPISNTFRECGPGCLPHDHAPYDFGRTGLGVRQVEVDADEDMDESEEASRSIPKTPPAASNDAPAPDMNEPEEKSVPAPAAPATPAAPTVPAERSDAAPINVPEVPPAPAVPSGPTSSVNEEGSTTNRSSAIAGKWTKSASMTKKWSQSVFAKISGNSDPN